MFKTVVLSITCNILLAATGCSDQSKAGDKDLPADRPGVAALNYRDMPLETISGETVTLRNYEGRAVLLVNVASRCGYTPQYAGLEELYRLFKDSGLVVVGFPANDFGGQEPGSNEEILNFCQSRFDVTFPMMAKVSVKGDDKHPLFRYLTEKSDLPGEIKWNFSKFLLDQNGNLVARFDSPVEPMSDELVGEVRTVLEETD